MSGHKTDNAVSSKHESDGSETHAQTYGNTLLGPQLNFKERSGYIHIDQGKSNSQ
jgi:hypothetical protein